MNVGFIRKKEECEMGEDRRDVLKGERQVEIQGSANPQTPGSENMRAKSCVLLPAAGRRTQ